MAASVRFGKLGLGLGLGFGLVAMSGVGCRFNEPSTTPTAPSAQPQGRLPPPGYYPPQQPPGYYPQQPPQGYPQQPGYYPPQQPQPRYPTPAPTQPAPAPTQPAPAPTQPAPAPTQPAQPYNPWLTMLGNLLNGGAPPAPAPQPQPAPAPTTPPAPPAPSSIDARSLELANALNAYRAQNGLPPIPISKSLSHVAATHVQDLSRTPKMAANCNGHSWSSNGAWTPCCYTEDHAQAKCMWQKPAELTQFKGTGFEITIGQPGEKNTGFVLASPKAISMWQASSLHNDVILNRGTWKAMTWKAMGAGIIDSHACAWFSDQADPTP